MMRFLNLKCNYFEFKKAILITNIQTGVQMNIRQVDLCGSPCPSEPIRSSGVNISLQKENKLVTFSLRSTSNHNADNSV